MLHPCPRLPIVPVLAGLLAAAAGLPADRSFAQEPGAAAIDVRPEVRCDVGECAIRLTARIGDRVLRSDPLPFSAASPEIDRIAGDAAFGHVMPDRPVRPLTAWAVGREERSVGVAVDTVDTGVGGPAFLVYQMAGSDHVKRAHLVLVADDGSLAAVFSRVEGPGPNWIAMAPVDGGIEVERTGPEGTATREVLAWRHGASRPELVPVD